MPAISDEAVHLATGRTWPEWFALLDKARAHGLRHAAIAALLHEKHGVPGWWSQMVTVSYEQARGLREPHQAADGWQASGSRVIAAPAAAVFGAFRDAGTRSRWLDDPGVTIRKATPHRSLRITWVDGRSSLSVDVRPKGTGRSQVAVHHGRLADADAARRLKRYWATQLDALKALLEKQAARRPTAREPAARQPAVRRPAARRAVDISRADG